jgi:hypothetical protein
MGGEFPVERADLQQSVVRAGRDHPAALRFSAGQQLPPARLIIAWGVWVAWRTGIELLTWRRGIELLTWRREGGECEASLSAGRSVISR